MTLPKYKDLVSIETIAKIDQEILVLQKELFDLRLKGPTNSLIKPHFFVHAKRRIAQLNFKKSVLIKLSNAN